MAKIPLYTSIILIATGLIVLRYQFSEKMEVREGEVGFQAVVGEEPREKGEIIFFNLQGYRIITNKYTNISYGDVVRVEGVANKDGVLAFPTVEKISSGGGFQSFLFSQREKIEAKINRFLPEPQASLLSGVVLGVQKDLPKPFEEALRKTGTVHVVVVSGYNIGVVGAFFLALAGVIRRRQAIVLSLCAIVFYTLLTGAQPPTVRAAIMGSLAFSATFLGRQNLPLYSLFLAAFVMILIDPLVIKDIGFQLSFLATCGILAFKDSIFAYLKKLPSPFGEDLSITLSAQALVVPIIFFHFGQASLISPIVNALVLWTIPFSTSLGFIIAILSFIFEPAAQIVALIAWVPLSIFIWVVEAFSKAPLSLLQVPEKNFIVLIAYYALLSLIVFVLLKYVRIYKNKSR